MTPAAERELERQLTDALASGQASAAAKAYAEAASAAADEGDHDREAFFLTHALVYALEAASPLADTCAQRLRDLGRGD